MNLLFSINRSYIKHLKECIYSIARFPAEEGYDLYILQSDLEDEDKEGLEAGFDESLRFHYLSVDPSRISSFPQTRRYPEEIYYRIYAKEFLPESMDKILYLDADIVVINPLTELYNMPFEGNYYLACTHVRQFLNKVNAIRLGIKEDKPYINSGVLLINLEALRAEQDLSEVEQYVEKHKNALILPDQDIITALYGDRTGLLDSLKYNLSDRVLNIHNMTLGNTRLDLDWVRENAVIVHYFGKNKPWSKGYMGILDVFYHENVDAMKSQHMHD